MLGDIRTLICSQLIRKNTPLYNEAYRTISPLGILGCLKPLTTGHVESQQPNFRLIDTLGSSACTDAREQSQPDVDLRDLELPIDGNRYVFNLTWLRDSCHCSKCTHQYTRQRLFTPKDFKRDHFTITQLEIVKEWKDKDSRWPGAKYGGSYLKTRWIDGHESLYPLDWLRYIHNLYADRRYLTNLQPSQKLKFPKDDLYSAKDHSSLSPSPWSVAKIVERLQPVSFSDLTDNFVYKEDAKFINANKITDMSSKRYQAMLSLTNQLVLFGLAKIVGVPLERNQVLSVTRSLAYDRPTGYGRVFDVTIEPSEEINLAYSSLEFDLHSDLTYRETSPGVQLLHCIRNSTTGGLSYFSDAYQSAKILKEEYPELFQVLAQFPATFIIRDPYRAMNFRKHKTVIAINHEGELEDVYYSPFMLPPVGNVEDIKLFYLAMDKFTRLLQSGQNKFVTKMEPGELFMFHNRRVLHGRSSYNSADSQRFLQGCYMDWDEVRWLHEKLHNHK